MAKILQALGVEINYETFTTLMNLLNGLYEALPNWLKPIAQAILRPLLDALMSALG
ncbi:hypothetical protein [Archaeoglobus fulgidus]|uniref:hypothetical protein n=1 Tax=Archaeoglobus fulgidus TaxID=2234 RepID=UPI0012DE02A2|nr:hypothetical protein [Archaeoglobus fulgidus]